MSKSNQTRYGVFHVYLERKRKRLLVELVYKKVRFSVANFDLFGYSIFKNIEIYWVKELSKTNQTRQGVSHVYLERKEKRIFGIACLERSSYFNQKYRLIRLLYAYSIFKNIEILSGQGVLQIEPNSQWSIPCVPRA